MIFFIDLTSNVEVGEARCADPKGCSELQLFLLFLQWWKWAKKGSHGESNSKVS